MPRCIASTTDVDGYPVELSGERWQHILNGHLELASHQEISSMSITIGSTTFDRVSYDREADVLYLHVGDPRAAVEFDATPEGYALRYDAGGCLVGLTIVNAKRLLDERGSIDITISERISVNQDTLGPALVA